MKNLPIPNHAYSTPVQSNYTVIVGNVGTVSDPEYRIVFTTLPRHLVPVIRFECRTAEVYMWNVLNGTRPAMTSEYFYATPYMEVGWGVTQLINAYVRNRRLSADPDTFPVTVTILPHTVLHPVS